MPINPERFREALAKAKMTAHQLAVEARVEERHVLDLLDGRTPMGLKAKDLRSITASLDTSTVYLTGGWPNPMPATAPEAPNGCMMVPIDGGTAIVCTRGRRRRAQPKCEVCGRNPGSKLCDGPSDLPGKTCDVALCPACATHVRGRDLDYCPAHKLLALGNPAPITRSGELKGPLPPGPDDPGAPPEWWSVVPGLLEGEALVTAACRGNCGLRGPSKFATEGDADAVRQAGLTSSAAIGLEGGYCPRCNPGQRALFRPG